jgi:hypothetical protein
MPDAMPPMDEQPPDPLRDAALGDRYLEDDGFTVRTLGRLPQRRRSWRRWILGTAVLLSVLTAAMLSPEVVGLLARLWRSARTAATSVTGAWSLTALAIAVIVAAALTLLVLREEAR